MKVTVPDIGDFTDVPVIEILVAVGDEVQVESPLVTLESDKATMDIPSPVAGKVTELAVAVGDTVSEGDVVAEVAEAEGAEPAAAAEPAAEEAAAAEPADAAEPAAAAEPADEPSAAPADTDYDVVVVGSGPGGYTAAFRAADLGKSVALVEKHERLGGVCLNVGCIPSKALLHTAKVITDAEAAHGLSFAAPEIDLDGLREWKQGVVTKLTDGLAGMARGRKVTVLHGDATFTGANELKVGDETVTFANAIVAAGSRAAWLPSLPDDPRVMHSTGALEIEDIPERLLVVGGGIIGLEMACVYDALGSKVTVVELLDTLIPGCDPDLVKPLEQRIRGRYEAIHLGVRVDGVDAKKDGLHVTFAGDDAPEPQVYDRVLVAIGRVPNGGDLGLDAAGVTVDERGFVPVDERQRTNVTHIYAIGDVVGQPMLAHKAMHEAAVAAEVIAGHDVVFDPKGIPSVAYTDPEVAWVGLTETEAAANRTPVEKAVFPWAASGRALSMEASGMTKLLVDPDTRHVLGAGIVGANAGELVAEIGLAIEMGAVAEDLALTIHAHPTLSETVGLAAEVAEGTVTDLPPARRKR
ncbi:MAG TPA: dihydrolipoyl dehydrogenase [Solirubrobacteraceae bacterium]